MDSQYSINVGVGRTSTDLVLMSSDGRVDVLKVPSVASDPSAAVGNAVAAATAALGTSVSTLLARTAIFVHTADVATDIVAVRKRAANQKGGWDARASTCKLATPATGFQRKNANWQELAVGGRAPVWMVDQVPKWEEHLYKPGPFKVRHFGAHP